MARIIGVDIPRNKIMKIAIRSIYGVGSHLGDKILKEANVDLNKNSNDLSEEEAQKIRQVMEDSYNVEGDLRREVGLNIKRLKDLGCYRGVRHRKGLPCRGQRTHTNARTKKGKKVAIAGKKSVKSLK